MYGEGTDPRHAATPQRIRWFVLGRSPDSEVLVHRLPGVTQWHIDEPALPYRCGGSAGIEREAPTGFPFHPAWKTMRGHHERGGV
jgi:hypothetical protein